tara:strand:- start:101 stop:394 length:294 start_codon:yes stop_codon:yes gene_type:complete
MKKIKLIIITTLFFVGCGSSDPSGEYRVGTSYSYFSSNGDVSFYKSDGVKYCNTKGSWIKEGENIYVSNLYNPNCPDMSRLNGTYIIEGGRLVGLRQ